MTPASRNESRGYWLSHEIKDGFPPYSGYDCALTKGLIIVRATR